MTTINEIEAQTHVFRNGECGLCGVSLDASKSDHCPYYDEELSAAEVAPDGTPLENVRLCPRCGIYDIDGKTQFCESCVDEINEEYPDGQWCFSTDAGCWVYE
jgi:hypothetical protein